MASKKTVQIQLSKYHGAPKAVMHVASNASLASMQSALGGLFKNKLALKSVGLKFCEGCRSGLDIDIRTHYEAQIDVQVLG